MVKLEKLFHGGGKEIQVYEIDLTLNSLPCDFANGFYTTPFYNEAIDWANLKDPPSIVINEYSWISEKDPGLSVKLFDTANVEWFKYVRSCRSDNRRPNNCDVVIGPVALISDYELFRTSLRENWDDIKIAQELDSDLKRAYQVVFCTKRGIKTLEYVRSSYVLEDDSYE
jgi:hypothetical protein